MIFLQPDEKIIRIVRKHWFILFAETFFMLFLFLIPFLAYIAFKENVIPLNIAELIGDYFTQGYLYFAGSVWTLVIWMRLSAYWADYFLDTWVITDKRIIDIEQIGFFNRSVSSFRLERIQDISLDVHGILATLLDFGDLHVQTAGEKRSFVIKGIGNPEKIKDIIRDKSDATIQPL